MITDSSGSVTLNTEADISDFVASGRSISLSGTDTATVEITPAADNLVEGIEAFSGVLSSPSSDAVLGTSTATAEFIDPASVLAMDILPVMSSEEALIDYEIDGGRNANHHETSTYEEALAAQNGNNHQADNLIFKNINKSEIDFGDDDSDKVVVVTGNTNKAEIDMGEGGNNVLIFTNHAPTNCEIKFDKDGNNVVVLPISKDDYDEDDYDIKNADGIYFLGSHDSIGDVSAAMVSSEAVEGYELDIFGVLSDTVTVSGLPEDTQLMVNDEAQTADDNGHYQLTITDGEIADDVKITTTSGRELSEEELGNIHAEVSVTNSETGEVETTIVDDNFLQGTDDADIFAIDNDFAEDDSMSNQTFISGFDVDEDVLDISDVISSDATEDTLSNYLNLSLVDADGDGDSDDTLLTVDSNGNDVEGGTITQIFIQDNDLTDNNIDDLNIDFQDQ
ncbi:MAG: hypothetical protein COZ36_09025 [Piscirickettsiaceae bacterium CG_4_10_14_3_um_filter_44_349]|nr:MAG: hypothetical protein COZ36_09025 [Piscirickettsiaceae bacterium CG_4_10_14_3_um_filter_44_349]